AVTAAGSQQAPLRDALAPAIAAWVERHHHAASPTDMTHLVRAVAPKAVAGANAELAIAFEVLGYRTEKVDQVPLSRARVRVRIADREHVVFERVVVTDSVVGERNLSADALAARVAHSVLDILEPHIRRVAPAWRP